MAKRIISKFDIERLKSEGHKTLRLEPGDTLTPLARDTALELGVKIEEGSELGRAPAAPAAQQSRPDDEKLEAIVKAVLSKLGPAAGAATCAPCATPKVYGQSPNKIKHVKMPLDRDMPPTELHDAQGVLRNPPEIGFRLLDVVTMDDSASIAGGFMSFHEGAGIKWTLNYDEIEYVVEGLVEITYDDGKKITATTGDTIFIPKGTSLHWNTPTWVKIFYATFPSNWADQV
jgi:ethanolamine utilization protein EutQ